MAIANYTTTIEPAKTVGEINEMLAQAGAKSIRVNYENREPVSIFFIVEVDLQLIPFRLPASWEGVLKAMKQDESVRKYLCKEEQAKRVAWRIVRDWVRAQLAFIEAHQASMAQLFLPHMVREDGQTLYEVIEEKGFRAIAPGK